VAEIDEKAWTSLDIEDVRLLNPWDEEMGSFTIDWSSVTPRFPNNVNNTYN